MTKLRPFVPIDRQPVGWVRSDGTRVADRYRRRRRQQKKAEEARQKREREPAPTWKNRPFEDDEADA